MIGRSLSLLSCFWVSSAAAFAQAPSEDCVLQITEAHIREAIDSLVNFGGEKGSAKTSLDLHEQFRVIRHHVHLSEGKAQVKPVEFNSAYRQLVRLGPRALPLLLAHLSDNRVTKCTVSYVGKGMGFFVDNPVYYDYRYRDENFFPNSGQQKIDWNKVTNSYTLRVGDVCYEAIGEIVGRRYSLQFPYGVINSPVQNPRLTVAVLLDWSGLSKEEHLSQLERDANYGGPWASFDSLQTLFFYDPSRAEDTAIRLINRGVYYDGDLFDTESALEDSTDPQVWNREIGKLTKKVGPEVASLLPIYVDAFLDRWKDSSRAKEMLRTAFPKFNYPRTGFSPWAGLGEQRTLMYSIECMKGEKVDLAALGLLRRSVGLADKADIRSESGRDLFVDALLVAQECGERLAGKGYDNELLTFFVPAAIKLREKPKESETYVLKDLDSFIARLYKH